MDFKTDMTIGWIDRLCSDNAEADDRRAARVEHLEEFVWRGDYRVAARDIVEAMLATGPRLDGCPAASGRCTGRGASRLMRTAHHF